MGARNLSREEYAMNHPAERIGKSLIFKVRDVMKKKEELPICKEQDLIMDQLVELTSKGCGCLLVIDDGFHLLGTFPDGDLRRTLKASGEGIFKLTVGDMCNRFSTSLSRWRKQKRHSSGESWMLSFNYSFTNRKTEPEELQGQIYLAQ